MSQKEEVDLNIKDNTKVDMEIIQEPKQLSRSVYFGIIFREVIISTVVISANGNLVAFVASFKVDILIMIQPIVPWLSW